LKVLFSFPLILILLSGLTSVGTLAFGVAQSPEILSGTISSDTTLTKANSPYNLTGPLLINNGVTLTIEPATTINLNNFTIEVNGTLNAKGDSYNKIHFNSGTIGFTKFSPNWNESAGKGNIIENAKINASSIAIIIGDTSPKINNNSIVGSILTAGSDNITSSSAPIISNNTIVKSGYGLVLQVDTSPIIANNTIKGSIRTGAGSTIISGNYIEGSIESNGEHDYIAENTLCGPGNGYGIRTGFTLIEHNLIADYEDAILFWIAGFPIIRNNTIVNNTNGISILGYIRGSYSPQIYWNNIFNNSEYNINLSIYEAIPSEDINATYNWWGTTMFKR
jgi:parallel beta-helix repeat protein